MFDVGVFIGRFQPFHAGHAFVIEAALKACRRLIIVIGSAGSARNIRNPFTIKERLQLIQENLDYLFKAEASRITLKTVIDYFYDESAWLDDVSRCVSEVAGTTDQIVIVGHDKDDSTYYLKGFPEWGFVAVENYHSLNATEIRNAYLEGRLESDSMLWNYLPKPTQDFLQQFKRSEGYLYLTEEYACIRKRQKSWQPGHFPVIYTTDAVVICQQKLLLIRRKYFPGKGLWALPGGHLESGESIEHGVFRELLEETQLAVSEEELRAGLKMVREFAHPNRSTVGRIVTHAGLILLNRHALPQVHAADDADDVRWHSLNALDDLLGQLHDDHYQIVRTLLKDNKILME